jgi:hypothetical protein
MSKERYEEHNDIKRLGIDNPVYWLAPRYFYQLLDVLKPSFAESDLDNNGECLIRTKDEDIQLECV